LPKERRAFLVSEFWGNVFVRRYLFLMSYRKLMILGYFKGQERRTMAVNLTYFAHFSFVLASQQKLTPYW